MSDHTTEATDHVPTGIEGGNPSMEDILASIRRIIADDDAQTVTQTADNLEINPLETNLDALAAPGPDNEALSSLILDTETGLDSDVVLDLEDILVLDEDDFSEDTLEIPDIDMLEQTLTGAPQPEMSEVVNPVDDNFLDLESMLNSSLDDMDLTILEATDDVASTSETPIAMDMPLDEVELPRQIETFDDALIVETPTAVETAEASKSDDVALSDDIFSALDADLDLVLDDGAFDTGLSLTGVEPEPSNVTVPESDPVAEMEALLTAIDQNISEIETPEVDREQAAIEIETLLDGDDMLDDPLNDLMSTFLTEDDDAPREPVVSADAISQPEITNIADDTDIELVKSLMADLTDTDMLSEPTTQDALITPEITITEPPTPVAPPVMDLLPEKNEIDDVLDEIFELAMEDEATNENEDLSDGTIENIEASISSLLKIAAEAEQDAVSPAIVAEPLPELMPEVLDVMLTQAETLHSDLAAIQTQSEIEDIDSLFSDSLISATETPSSTMEQSETLTPETPAPQTVVPEAIDPEMSEQDDIIDTPPAPAPSVIAEPLAALEPEPTPMPSLAIEALAAQTFSLDDLMDLDEADDVSETIEAITTPDTTNVAEALPAPSVDEAILPEPETPVVQEQAVAPAPLTLPDPEPVARVLAVDATPEPEANPTIDIAPTTAPEKESSEMTKAAVSESILDEVTESATSGAFASLTSMVEAKTDFEESGPRIGDLVQEALRPMLKDWLDENLKGIVERAIQKEVKRISSGG